MFPFFYIVQIDALLDVSKKFHKMKSQPKIDATSNYKSIHMITRTDLFKAMETQCMTITYTFRYV